MPPNRSRSITVIFGCQYCDAVYEAIQERVAGGGKFECNNCGAIVHAWSGQYNFTDWLRCTVSDGFHEQSQRTGQIGPRHYLNGARTIDPGGSIHLKRQ